MLSFKRTLTPFKFLFSLFKTHLSTWYRPFSPQSEYKKYCTYLVALTFCVSFSRISSTTLLTMALFSICMLFFLYGVITMVLSRLNFRLLRNKVSQDLTSIIWMSGAVNETYFRFALWAIYILFLALSGALSCSGASIRQGGFSYLIPAVTSTVGIFPGRFFIIRFYYTFVNRFCDFRMLKYINSLFISNGFAIKALNIGLFIPSSRHTV